MLRLGWHFDPGVSGHSLLVTLTTRGELVKNRLEYEAADALRALLRRAVNASLDRLDLAGTASQVIDAIDLPGSSVSRPVRCRRRPLASCAPRECTPTSRFPASWTGSSVARIRRAPSAREDVADRVSGLRQLHPNRVTPGCPLRDTVGEIRATAPVRPTRGAPMTELGSSRPDLETSRVAYGNRPDPTGWTGWVVFASFMMFLLGAFQAIQGLVALFDDGFYIVSDRGLVVDLNYNVWGTIHLILGILLLLSGAGVLTGNLAARTVGVILAGLSALANLVFIEAYPIWSVIIITVDVLVIYALTVHGRELKDSA
jgi:hypothetical protein